MGWQLLAIVPARQYRAAKDRLALRVIRWCLHVVSDRAALDLFLVQLDYWAGPRGKRIFATLHEGKR